MHMCKLVYDSNPAPCLSKYLKYLNLHDSLATYWNCQGGPSVPLRPHCCPITASLSSSWTLFSAFPRQSVSKASQGHEHGVLSASNAINNLIWVPTVCSGTLCFETSSSTTPTLYLLNSASSFLQTRPRTAAARMGKKTKTITDSDWLLVLSPCHISLVSMRRGYCSDTIGLLSAQANKPTLLENHNAAECNVWNLIDFNCSCAGSLGFISGFMRSACPVLFLVLKCSLMVLYVLYVFPQSAQPQKTVL